MRLLQVMLEAPTHELHVRSKLAVMSSQQAVQRDGAAQVNAGNSSALEDLQSGVDKAQKRHAELSEQVQAYKALRQQDEDDVAFKVRMLDALLKHANVYTAWALRQIVSAW